MGFTSTGELIRAAGRFAAAWGDPEAGIEHAAVAVLERSAAAGAVDCLRVATAIAAARETAAGSHRFAGRGAPGGTVISTELRRALEPLAARLPRDADEWLAWAERTLRASPRPLLRAAATDVMTMIGTLRSGTATGARGAVVPFTLDLTELAATGALSPVFGRDAELAIVMRVLGRRVKNHPVLIGPPGVGKTAIVELLAARIAAGSAPSHLQGVRILQLSVGELLAGSRYRGDLEERLGRVIHGLGELGRGALLFIDEVHLLVGAGSSEGSAVDLANLLKPPLARGAIHLIGATTQLEYDERIRQDPALERRLHPIRIPEPTLGETARILDCLRPSLESHYGVTVPAEVVRRAVLMSSALLIDRVQPDKAIDLLDEACAHNTQRPVVTAPGVVSTDDLLAVAAGWRDGDATRAHPAARMLPATPRDTVVATLIGALGESSLVAASPPQLVELSGGGDMTQLLEDLRHGLGDVVAIEVQAADEWSARNSGGGPAAATIVLVPAGDSTEAPSPSVTAKLSAPTTTPCLFVLTEGSALAAATRPGLVLRFPDSAEEAAERAIRQLVRMLAGSTGRIRVAPSALRTWVAVIVSADRAGDDQALRTLQRQISEAVTKALPRLAAGRDLVIDAPHEGPGVVARESTPGGQGSNAAG